MKKDRRLLKIVNQAVVASFDKGRLVDAKVKKFVKSFKSLSGSHAIFALSHYLKGLRYKIQMYTLVIESSHKLQLRQIKNIATTLRKHHFFSRIETKVNPTLLGGLRLKIGDLVIDSTLENKISQIGGIIRG